MTGSPVLETLTRVDRPVAITVMLKLRLTFSGGASRDSRQVGAALAGKHMHNHLNSSGN